MVQVGSGLGTVMSGTLEVQRETKNDRDLIQTQACHHTEHTRCATPGWGLTSRLTRFGRLDHSSGT